LHQTLRFAAYYCCRLFGVTDIRDNNPCNAVDAAGNLPGTTVAHRWSIIQSDIVVRRLATVWCERRRRRSAAGYVSREQFEAKREQMTPVALTVRGEANGPAS